MEPNFELQIFALALKQPDAIIYFAENLPSEVVGIPSGNTGIHEFYLNLLEFYKHIGTNIIDPIALREWLVESDLAAAMGGEGMVATYIATVLEIEELTTPEAITNILKYRANKRKQLDSLQELQLLLAKKDYKSEEEQRRIGELTDTIRLIEQDIGYDPLATVQTATQIAEKADKIWDLPDFIQTQFPELNKVLGYVETGGFCKGAVHAVIAQSGFGKPLSVDTCVSMGDGSLKRLGDIEVGDSVVTGKGRVQAVSQVFEQGVLPTLKITTRNGRNIISALDHPFWTPYGWKEAQNLRVGESLAVPREIVTESSPNDRTTEEFRIAGYIIGDGSVSSGNCNVVCFDPIQGKEIERCVNDLGFWVRITSKGCYRMGGGIRQWLRERDLYGKNSRTKRVPSWVFRGTKEQISHFLASYFECDGYINKYNPLSTRKSGIPIYYYSVNKDLLIDVQHLLGLLGIQTTLRMKKGTYNRAEHISWMLYTSNNETSNLFFEKIPVLGQKAERIESWSHRFRKEFHSEYFSDEILSIEEHEPTQCRCITVEEDHTFLANGVVVRNSTIVKCFANYWADQGHTVLYVNYEEAEAHWDRVLMTQLTGKNVYEGASDDEKLYYSNLFRQKLAGWGDRFMVRHDPDTPYFDDLEKWLRDIIGHGGHVPDIVIIDTIQSMFMKGSGGKPRWGQFEEMMVRLEKLAKDMHAVFIITSQENSNRSKEGREIVQQSDAGGSLTIIQKSAVTIFLTRKNLMGEDDSIEDTIMELQIPKNRITGGKYIKQPPLVRYNDNTKSYEAWEIVDTAPYKNECTLDIKGILI